MSSPKLPSAAADQRRRKFLKTALAGAFAAPVVTSLAVDHLMNTARAQQAYVPPSVVSFTRTSPPAGVGASPSATYEVLFSQPIDTASHQCWSFTIFNGFNCFSGSAQALVTYSGYSFVLNQSWTNNDQTLVISNVDETHGGAIAVGHVGSVGLIVNEICSEKLLGTNGLAVVTSTHCVNYSPPGPTGPTG